MAASGAGVERIVQQQVYIRGANRPFGELTTEDARERADELKAATGWGPTARVASYAFAWRELSMEMERSGVATVSELDPHLLVSLAPKLWVVLPGDGAAAGTGAI
jgi:hypothetical protein